jgi:hypothetical protein
MKPIRTLRPQTRAPGSRPRSVLCRGLWTAGLLLALPAVEPGTAFGDVTVPAAINYQGKLTDSDGHAVTAGYYDVEFRIWNHSESSGEINYFWGRVFSLSVANNGLFNVLLTDAGGGLSTPSTNQTSLMSAFDGDTRYLGLTIVSERGTRIASPVEITPRQQLLSAPYAIRAQQATAANTATWANNAGAATNSTHFGLFVPDDFVKTNKLAQTLTGNLTVNGKIGIGNLTPAYPLHFASETGDKISLYGFGSAHYGFGIQDYLLQVYTSRYEEDIAFGYGGSTSFTERMRVRGNGRVGIGTNAPEATLHVRGTTMLDLSPNGGGALVLGNNANDNSIYLEGVSSNHTANASAIHIAGHWSQPLPVFDITADAVKIKNQLPIVIRRYPLPDPDPQDASNTPYYWDPPNGYPTNAWSAAVIGFTCHGDFSESTAGLLLDIAMQAQEKHPNWRVQFDVRHHSTLTNIVVDVMYIRRELTDDTR